jgi:F-type H+-transporting ATPase subunit epsilon
MEPFYRVQLVTPQGIAYIGEVIHTLLPAENGFVGVLANHASYVTSSSGGVLTFREKEGLQKKFKVGSGFFSVSGNQASFLTDSSQPLEG